MVSFDLPKDHYSYLSHVQFIWSDRRKFQHAIILLDESDLKNIQISYKKTHL